MMDKQSFDKKRYEREIEEILEKYDQENDKKPKADRPDKPSAVNLGSFYPSRPSKPGSRPWGLSWLPKDWRRVSAGQYIAAAFVVALLAVLLRNFSSVLATVLILVSVVLFLVPIVLYRSTGTTSGGWSSQEQKRWRGQVIDFNTRRDITNDPLASIRRFFRRK